ncbi:MULTISPECIES: methyltransferase domain-containing protein [unclassified Variovorax]|jgi:ubiquinone/menaquinone biosynthesis C-methylase UbiE|uniref:class I SAM-dependent methyltransferase n=1 Tax=unclassified Variovorax TaxID=663243 RepID=UPI000F7D7507|nr:MULTISPECIES: methyltransferase domain-containing protein [unclassified Variovorax]RSZ44193.1 class I SAM-dependent methyltransferase [Variovorax sp. 553]RSZ45151.1 class I SAM-dependent methyltransferase [Variovorax sp. 679]
MSEFERLLREADARPLVGWELSCDGRIATTATSWNFEQTVDRYARKSPDMLDMGTGGGEWLSRLPFRPPRTVATEGWAPNVDVARERLAPLGVEVVEVEGADDNALQLDDAEQARLPFADASFHLVVNRHESFVASDVHRILAAGGRFVTQQVASDFNADCYELLRMPMPELPRWKLDTATAQLERAGLVVEEGGEGAELLAFADIGAFAWYLKHVPYVCPEFSIDGCRAALERLHQRIEQGEALAMRQKLFWLEAVRR